VKTDLSVPFYTYHTANYSPAAAADKAVLMGWLGDPPKGRYRLIIRLRDEGLKSAAPSNFEYEPSGGLLDVAETKEFAMA
jgi:hypothetical protein